MYGHRERATPSTFTNEVHTYRRISTPSQPQWRTCAEELRDSSKPHFVSSAYRSLRELDCDLPRQRLHKSVESNTVIHIRERCSHMTKPLSHTSQSLPMPKKSYPTALVDLILPFHKEHCSHVTAKGGVK